MVFGGILPPQTAEAFGGSTWANRVFNTTTSHSYFENRFNDAFSERWSGQTNHVIQGGIPGWVNTADTFVDFLWSTYTSSNLSSSDTITREKAKSSRVGAAFMIYTMLGYNGDQANAAYGRYSVPKSMFEDVRARVKSANVNWNTTVCTDMKSTMSSVNPGTMHYDIQRDRWSYANNKQECGGGIVITDRTGKQYRILHRCANPIGTMEGLAPAQWTATPSTTVTSAASVDTPGQTLTWQHSVTNTGNATTDRTVTYTAQNRGLLGTGNVQSWTAATIPSTGTNFVQQNTTALITQDHVGGSLCRRTTVTPSSTSNSGTTHSADACRDIPYRYDLNPSITSSPQAIEPGQPVPAIVGSVANTGPTKSYNSDIQYTRIIYKQGQTAPSPNGMGTGGLDSCAYYGMTSSQERRNRCTVITPDSGANNIVFMTGPRTVPSVSDTVPSDFDIGDRICYGISVSGYNAATGAGKTGARHSALVCVTVGKKPKVHVIGGDLYVGRDGSSGAGAVSTSISMSGRSTVVVPPEVIDDEVANTQRYWYFGKGAGLHFKDSGVTPTVRTSNMVGDEGTTVATDRRGDVQFFTDGLNIYRPNGSVMPNGGSIGSTSTTTQAAASFPIKDNKYIVVTTSAASENNKLGDLRYTVVDMSANAGTGAVISKNQAFGPQGGVNMTGEAISVAPNAANNGYWVVVNRPGTNVMRSFAVPYTWDGLGGGSLAPVDSATGTVSGSPNGVTHAPGFGTINFDKSYGRAVIAMQRLGTSTGTVRVLDFNAATGRFTERFNWTIGEYYVYSADFSPDGNYVYATSLYNPPGANGGNGHLFRYKLSGMSTSAQVKASEYGIAHGSTGMPACAKSGGGGQVKRAPNGKMYVARINCNVIGVINNPDAVSNAGIGWNMSGQALPAGSTSSFGLPQVAAVLVTSVEPPVYERTVYGSWSEYGIAARGAVAGMGSAAAYAGGIRQEGATLRAVNLCDLSFLSFANAGASGSCSPTAIGGYTVGASARTIGDYYANMPFSTLLGTSVVANNLSSGVHRPMGTGGTITLQASTLAKSKSIVIYAPNSDIAIAGNQQYIGGSYSNVREIPQLVIIARSIVINSAVTNVDSWLVAKKVGTVGGYIQTCQVVATSSSGNCSARLTVNGPVVSDTLIMRRTAGADRNTGADPAEVFNLRPDAYMWGVSQSGATGRIPTTAITELPPRF